MLNLSFFFRSKQGYPYSPMEPQKNSHLIVYLFIWILFFLMSFWLVTLYITKKQESQIVWKFEVSSEIASELIFFDEYLYFTDVANQLYSLLNDGSLNWKVNLGCGTGYAITVAESQIFVLAKHDMENSAEDISKCPKNESIYVVDRLYGGVIDTISGESLFIYGVDDRYVYYSSDLEVKKYNLNTLDSSEVLEFADVGLFDVDPESGLYVGNNTLIIKDIYYNVFFLDLDAGAVKWKAELNIGNFDSYLNPSLHDFLRTIIHSNDMFYTFMINDSGYKISLYSFDLKEGRVLEGYRTGFRDMPSSLLITDKYLYVLLNDSRVDALSNYDYLKYWSLSLSEKLQGSMLSYQGVIYAATQSGGIIGFDEITGKKLYRYSSGYSIVGTPIINDGIIYFVTNTLDNFVSIHAVLLNSRSY